MYKYLLLISLLFSSCNDSEHNHRQSKSIKLKNGLNVYLVSDDRTQKSTASINVSVGSFFDTKEGLTHFLEHMLFLGTSKYPQAGAFNKFINTNQGSFNGYTSSENTNYYFEIDDAVYPEALDRFSGFFKNPLFNEAFVKKEKNAVDSEFKLRMENDKWRERRVENAVSNPKHPISRFTIGTLETLKDISRSTLLDFFNKYYVASNMDLVLISKLKLPELENLANKYFADIKAGKVNDDFPQEKILSQVPSLLKIVPKTDRNILQLEFELPNANKYWQSKPDYILASLIGHEGKGSLLSLLKAKDLALELSAGISNVSRNSSMLEVVIKLSASGVKNYKDIIKYFFAYINMLKSKKLEHYYYEDLKQIADINYKYKSHISAIEEAPWLAKYMYLFKNPSDIDKNLSIFFKYSNEDFKLFLNKIKPNLMRVVLVNKDLKPLNREKYMGVLYDLSTLDTTLLSVFEKAKDSNLFYPEKNKYIPENLSIIDSKIKVPQKIIDNEKAKFWLQNDGAIKLPKLKFTLSILTDKTLNTDIALKKLYVKVLNESLREWSYPIIEAGASYSIEDTTEGIDINIFSYNDKFDELLNDLINKLIAPSVDNDVFESLKEEIVLYYSNISKKYPYEQALYNLSILLNKYNKLYTEYINDFKNIKQIEVQNFSKKLFKKIYIKGFTYGSIDKKTILASIENIYKDLKSSTLAKEDRIDKYILEIPESNNETFFINTSMENSVFLRFYEVAKFTPAKSALWKLISSIVNPFFYTELRTKEQFGYVVFADRYGLDDVFGYIMLIQSPNSRPEAIEIKVKEWLKKVDNYFSAYAISDFKKAKESIISELEKEQTNITGKFSLLNTIVNIYDGDYLYRDKIIAELKKMQMADVVAEFAKYVQSPKLSSSASIYMYKNGISAQNKKVKELSSHIDNYKNNLDLF